MDLVPLLQIVKDNLSKVYLNNIFSLSVLFKIQASKRAYSPKFFTHVLFLTSRRNSNILLDFATQPT